MEFNGLMTLVAEDEDTKDAVQVVHLGIILISQHFFVDKCWVTYG